MANCEVLHLCLQSLQFRPTDQILCRSHDSLPPRSHIAHSWMQRKILVESSERLVREFSEVTNRVVSVCDEADGILDAFTSDAESDAGMPAALEDKQDHNKNGEGRTVSAAREIVDEIQRKIKCFETTSNGSNEHASSRSKGCHSEDGNPLAPAAAAAASVFASVNPMEDPTLRGPVALSEGMALPLLRKRVKAFQPSFGTGGQDGSDSSNSAIYYGSIPGSSTSPGQEQFRSTATPVDCIVGRSAGGVGSTRVSRGGSRTAEAAVAAGRVGAGRGASGMRGQVLTEGDRGWKGKSRATDKAPKEISDEMLLSIFGYWAAKRQAYGGPMLRCLHSFIMELWERMADPDPEVRLHLNAPSHFSIHVVCSFCCGRLRRDLTSCHSIYCFLTW